MRFLATAWTAWDMLLLMHAMGKPDMPDSPDAISAVMKQACAAMFVRDQRPEPLMLVGMLGHDV